MSKVKTAHTELQQMVATLSIERMVNMYSTDLLSGYGYAFLSVNQMTSIHSSGFAVVRPRTDCTLPRGNKTARIA